MHNKEDNKLVQLSQNRSAEVGLINQDYGNYLNTGIYLIAGFSKEKKSGVTKLAIIRN